jgi:hypothetical protein
LANYRFDAEKNRVIKAVSGPGSPPQSTAPPPSANGEPATNILFLREGQVYFEGGQKAVLESKDDYLRRFLV